MIHKIEIDIKDDVLWNALCEYSSISQLKVSEIINKIGIERAVNLLFNNALNNLSEDKEVKNELNSKSEIKAFREQNI